jgi:hypothetical protein
MNQLHYYFLAYFEKNVQVLWNYYLLSSCFILRCKIVIKNGLIIILLLKRIPCLLSFCFLFEITSSSSSS